MSTNVMRTRGAPIRILHLTANSGRSTYFNQLAELTDPKEFRMLVWSLSGEGSVQTDMRERGVSAGAFQADARRDQAAVLPRLVRFLIGERIDIVQTHLFDACVLGLVAAKVARTPVRIYTGHHVSDLLYHRHRTGSRLSPWLDQMAVRWLSTHTIAPTEFAATQLNEQYGLGGKRLTVIPFGIEPYRPNEEARKAVRAGLGLANTIVLGSVGRLHWIKNVRGLIEAAAPALRDRSDLRLLLVGEGPERGALEATAERLGVSGQVVFAGYRRDIRHIYSAMDLFVSPSLTESFNQALLEAMAARLPVLATRVGLAADLADGGLGGEIVDAADPCALRHGLERLLERASSWSELGRRNAGLAEDFTPERMATQHAEVYRRALTATQRSENR